MSILADRGIVRPLRPVRQGAGPARVPAGSPSPARHPSGARERRGEPLRPPTRARVVAGHRSAGSACAEPRRPAVRWPWLVAIAVGACLVVTVLGVFGSGTPAGAVPERTAAVSVRQGDTLSDLAARFAPDSDQAAVVERIEELNHLDDGVLVPGLPLTVPVAAEVAGAGR
ncbi:LysM peptidoglycan-binding domain-containing protein [Amycolatopsis sp. FDAARGOS 1241]|uniref:LysM peptidoglycan-binding domain-containing protein n=1 Tax=Amycolatopsis sp. FDAARGOS 1241 TaxID=2778070 RepID=UPI00194E8EBF|nr:LysM peptidoglycan-binding domain-containing protein [Amycolatopsis sp. FDAARGOS 1241]QRP44089.1 LysM peptidoglycan-binding domain-containing protein [Amycolatopsis sp. FDAARGOS 1241]